MAALIRMFVNRYLEEANKDWFENYELIFNTYGLDTILGRADETDRYDIGKILYKLYYDKNYTWTDRGYVLMIDENIGKKDIVLPAAPTPIKPVDIKKPDKPLVLLQQPTTIEQRPLILTTNVSVG